jgi:hypothetical protein
MSDSSATGTEKVLATNVVWTASGGTIPTIQYAVVANWTTAALVKPMVCWFDYGSSLTLNSGDSLTVSFDASNGFFTMA